MYQKHNIPRKEGTVWSSPGFVLVPPRIGNLPTSTIVGEGGEWILLDNSSL
jgi:hypothetical protein